VFAVIQIPESELLYDWRFTANQFVLATGPLRLTTSNFIFQLNTCGYCPYVTSSWREDGSVVYICCWSSPAQSFLVRVPHFTVSDSRLPKPGGPGPRIYIPQEQGGPVTTAGTGFPFRRLLRLAGLRWRYSKPPPHGSINIKSGSTFYIPYRPGVEMAFQNKAYAPL
jgi:hypothetical protein